MLSALWKRLCSERGFTVIEYVSAASIMLIVAIAATGGLTFASTATGSAAKREEAMNIANQRIEQARNLPYDNVGVRYADGSYGNPVGDIVSPETVGEFTVNTVVTWARNAQNRSTYKKIYVTVSWDHPKSGDITVETAIMGKSSLTLVGDMLITLYDGATNKGMAGGLIEVRPSSGGSRKLTTDSKGQAFFGNLPTGAATVIATKPGYAIDLSPVASASVPTGDLVTYALYGVIPTRLNVHVVGTDGVTPIPDAGVSLTGQQTLSGTTSSSGDVPFDLARTGAFTVTVSKAGYVNGTANYTAVAGQTGTVTIKLSPIPPGSLRIYTKNKNGGLLPNTDVKWWPNGGATTTVKTNASGEYVVPNLVPGVYYVKVVLNAPASATAATVNSGAETKVTAATK